ncbi:MAG: Crp/Fnr family transcriptional regulator [Ruminococcaceae bacterium]|nr:Crp/Fnr family transcriptional regulator [Oscillospiraceae bacterium]
MKRYLPILKKCRLFAEIAESDLIGLLGCLGARVEIFAKHDIIFAEGDAAKALGIVLSGEVRIERVDYDGNRSIVSQTLPTGLFGESFACAEVESIPVDVVASEPSEVMLIDVHRITKSCCNACDFHNRIIFNLMQLVAVQNLRFHRKLMITSRRTTREKLLAYLSEEAKERGRADFEIPFDRQELADYLEVDRSGLSAEISKLRREGILEAERNRFVLL